MFYNNYDNVHGEDRWGMVGKTGDPFREGRKLAIPCYRCHQKPLLIAERNWMDTNNDDSQRYQIVVVCDECGAVDEFIVNDGREHKIGRLKHSKYQLSTRDIIE
ncbi:hypothetical protein H5S09_01115 [Limosilactobacillus sp. STM2_1]|uniref:Uncharacterized protein n=1 Tax=Limosilactobacillus rudii TaxID=2759755 RepID=A0A7W3YMR9_9LACO|nr:hypothetical protein [Limosilactobacillus rudii]MBB1078442.1 hypothetical protein [Limosilactobacillus rudii]MBB1096572.1 hypothetical protein [Limosilactobacillus rudii]MCD7134232.1 hypothetical protein [Limosilactobacillus rudii]